MCRPRDGLRTKRAAPATLGAAMPITVMQPSKTTSGSRSYGRAIWLNVHRMAITTIQR